MMDGKQARCHDAQRSGPAGWNSPRLPGDAPPPNLLLIDLCGIIYDSTAFHRWLLQLLSRFGLHASYASFYRLWETDYLRQVNLGEVDYWQALRAFLRSAGLTPGQIDEVEAAGHARRRQLEGDLRPFPGIPGILAELTRRGVQLAAISHAPWTSCQLQERLTQLRLASYFQFVFSPLELGQGTSSLDTFRAAVQSVGRLACEVAYVGHDPLSLEAASQAGLRTIAVNYDPGAQADLFLDDVQELLELLPPGPVQLLAG